MRARFPDYGLEENSHPLRRCQHCAESSRAVPHVPITHPGDREQPHKDPETQKLTSCLAKVTQAATESHNTRASHLCRIQCLALQRAPRCENVTPGAP